MDVFFWLRLSSYFDGWKCSADLEGIYVDLNDYHRACLTIKAAAPIMLCEYQPLDGAMRLNNWHMVHSVSCGSFFTLYRLARSRCRIR